LSIHGGERPSTQVEVNCGELSEIAGDFAALMAERDRLLAREGRVREAVRIFRSLALELRAKAKDVSSQGLEYAADMVEAALKDGGER